MLSRLSDKLVWGALGALLIVGAIYAAYSYVDSLTERLRASERALVAEQIARGEAEMRADEWKEQHDDMLRRFNELEARNRKSRAEIARLHSTISELNVERTVNEDPALAADRVNALSRDLNRMLERASGGAGAGGAP